MSLPATPRVHAAMAECIDAGGELGGEHRPLIDLARALERERDQFAKRLRSLYEAIPHNGEPGSALRRECEATRALIEELERT